MRIKEFCICLMTEYVISARRLFGGDQILYGVISGILIGLAEHENCTALQALYNEVIKDLYRR